MRSKVTLRSLGYFSWCHLKVKYKCHIYSLCLLRVKGMAKVWIIFVERRVTDWHTDMTKTRCPQISFMSYKTISNRDNVQSELLTLCEVHAQSNEHIPSTKRTKCLWNTMPPVVTRSVKKLFQHNGHDQGHEVGWFYWGFTSLQRYISHIATWKQEITNRWNSSGEAGNWTPDLLLRKPRA